MRLIIEQSTDCKETEIKITCGIMDQRLKGLIEKIKLYSFSIEGKKDGLTYRIGLERIFYFDSVDNRTYVYLENEVYTCEEKLYMLEELLAETPFVRISKGQIVNTNLVKGVKAQFNGRLEVTLINKEKVVVSKHYAKAFRDRFMMT